MSESQADVSTSFEDENVPKWLRIFKKWFPASYNMYMSLPLKENMLSHLCMFSFSQTSSYQGGDEGSRDPNDRRRWMEPSEGLKLMLHNRHLVLQWLAIKKEELISLLSPQISTVNNHTSKEIAKIITSLFGGVTDEDPAVSSIFSDNNPFKRKNHDSQSVSDPAVNPKNSDSSDSNIAKLKKAQKETEEKPNLDLRVEEATQTPQKPNLDDQELKGEGSEKGRKEEGWVEREYEEKKYGAKAE
ncbi:hypothetical protein Patl1_03527 [Pistacia atlantica]|uniref:Uncharacterized protein n=1 Tax=Pistacia atlantica TaxID=434234 RepID=A0ACC1CCS5_9ROSI|nr:hypothetical protein Patl1_03527 [Pistacia atlantica]